MKKISFIAVLLGWGVVFSLLSCGDASQNQGDMQKPITLSESVAPGAESEENEESSGMESRGGMAIKGDAKQALALNYSNIQEAFKGETTASAKYAEYSKKAEAEGYHQIALLFNAASISEKTHANNHRSVLEEAGQQVPVITPDFTVRSTKENLTDALAGETYEINTMYPLFLTNAAAAGNQLAQISLDYAYKTEQKHKPLYEKALAALEANDFKTMSDVYYICPTCGNTYDKAPPKRCGISMTSAEKFIRVSTITS